MWRKLGNLRQFKLLTCHTKAFSPSLTERQTQKFLCKGKCCKQDWTANVVALYLCIQLLKQLFKDDKGKKLWFPILLAETVKQVCSLSHRNACTLFYGLYVLALESRYTAFSHWHSTCSEEHRFTSWKSSNLKVKLSLLHHGWLKTFLSMFHDSMKVWLYDCVMKDNTHCNNSICDYTSEWLLENS